MRASGQALRSPDMGAYGGLGGRCKTQLRLNAPIIFFGPEAGTISTFDHRTRSILEHVSICSPSIRSPVWNRTDFCTSDHHLGITHGRKTVSPSRNLCDSDPFLVAIHNRCSPSDSHRSLFFGPKLERIRINGDRSPVRFFIYC